MVGGRESKCWQSRSPPRETKPSREVSREESVEPGLSWHRRCSLLVVRHVGVGGSAARWPPPHWGRFGARSRPLVVPVPADEHLQHPTMSRRACSAVLLSFFFGRSQHRSRIRDAHDRSRAGHSTGRLPSIHPSSPSRLIDVHLPTAPIQGIIKKALAFSVP